MTQNSAPSHVAPMANAFTHLREDALPHLGLAMVVNMITATHHPGNSLLAARVMGKVLSDRGVEHCLGTAWRVRQASQGSWSVRTTDKPLAFVMLEDGDHEYLVDPLAYEEPLLGTWPTPVVKGRTYYPITLTLEKGTMSTLADDPLMLDAGSLNYQCYAGDQRLSDLMFPEGEPEAFEDSVKAHARHVETLWGELMKSRREHLHGVTVQTR